MTRTRVSSKPTSPEAVLSHIEPGADIVMPNANGEPVELVDTLEGQPRSSGASESTRCRRCANGATSTASSVTICATSRTSCRRRAARRTWRASAISCRTTSARSGPAPGSTKCSLVIAAASPPNRHGYFSLGTNCDYTASLIGRAPFFLEANAQMPRTFGGNQLHVSQVVGWTEVDYPLIEAHPVPPTEKDRAIAALVAERIPDGATIQAGIGGMPNALLACSGTSRAGLHTELLSDGVVDLVEAGVVTGTRKVLRRGKVVATFALGSQRLTTSCRELVVDFAPWTG